MRTSCPTPGDGNDSSVALAAASSQLEICSCAIDPGLSVDLVLLALYCSLLL